MKRVAGASLVVLAVGFSQGCGSDTSDDTECGPGTSNVDGVCLPTDSLGGSPTTGGGGAHDGSGGLPAGAPGTGGAESTGGIPTAGGAPASAGASPCRVETPEHGVTNCDPACGEISKHCNPSIGVLASFGSAATATARITLDTTDAGYCGDGIHRVEVAVGADGDRVMAQVNSPWWVAPYDTHQCDIPDGAQCAIYDSLGGDNWVFVVGTSSPTADPVNIELTRVDADAVCP